MKVVGLTGNTGSGKSTVATYFADKYKATIIDCDKLGHEMLLKGSPAYSQLIQVFGNEVMDEQGNISRQCLRKVVFSDQNLLSKLNEISHYHIYEAVKEAIKNAKTKGEKLTIVDAALLLQSDVKELVEDVWVVISDQKMRINRLLSRDHLSKEQIMKRINAQWDNEKFVEHADVVIYNTEDLVKLYSQCDKLYIETM